MKSTLIKIILLVVFVFCIPLFAKANVYIFASEKNINSSANILNREMILNNEKVLTFEIVVDDNKYYFDETKLLQNNNTSGYAENNYNYIQGKFINYEQGVDIAKKTKKMGFDSRTIMNYLFVNFDREVDEIIKNINTEPQDAKIEFYNNKPSIKKEKSGRKINIYKLYDDILQAFISGNKVCVKNDTQKISPTVYTVDLEKYTAKRGQFSTSITGNNQEGRKQNIAQALSKFEGKRVEPGEKVSFNQTIGDTTPENGYSLAKIIVNGKFVDGYGGGVCQASTTLYNALLFAGVDIVEVNPHSLRVGYVAPSFDAMVSYGLSDLVFQNNTGSPIYISTFTNGSQCEAFVYGEAKNYIIKKRTEILDKDENTPENVNLKSRGILEYYQEGDLIKTKPIRKDTYYFPKTE